MSFVSVFSIVGIIVLAIAVIALAVSVAGISSRLKELTDNVMLGPAQGRRSQMDPYNDMYDLPPRRASYQQDRRSEMRRAPGPQRGSAPQRASMPQRVVTPQRDANSQRLAPQRDTYSSGYHDDHQSMNYDYQQSNMHDVDPYSSQSYSQAPVSSSGMRQSFGSSQDYIRNDPYGDDEFFETYRDRDDDRYRGRGRPTIPFGADKSVVDRRRDSYVGSVADSEYDPDSIDFTRVQGYKRTGGRY